MSAPDTPARRFDRNSIRGRILLALRAGEMEGMQFLERFGADMRNSLWSLIHDGYVRVVGEKKDTKYRITEAGRAACPNRRDPGPALDALHAPHRPRSTPQRHSMY